MFEPWDAIPARKCYAKNKSELGWTVFWVYMKSASELRARVPHTETRRNVNINMCPETLNSWVISARILYRYQQQISINVWVGIVGDCMAGPHDLFSYDLPTYWKMYHWQSRYGYGTCMMVCRPILAVLREEFSVNTYHDPAAWPPRSPDFNPRIFACGDTWKPLCMQLLLTTKRHFTIAFSKPVRLFATNPASLHGCGGPWLDVSRRALNLVENISCTYHKCSLSAVSPKLNDSWHMLVWTYFMFWYVEQAPLWSSGQSSWLQIQRAGFDSRRYQIFSEK
jgi:hypothetical protein